MSGKQLPTTVSPIPPFQVPEMSLGQAVPPGHHTEDLSLYLGFDHVIGSVVVDGSGLNNDAKLTAGELYTCDVRSHAGHDFLKRATIVSTAGGHQYSFKNLFLHFTAEAAGKADNRSYQGGFPSILLPSSLSMTFPFKIKLFTPCIFESGKDLTMS